MCVQLVESGSCISQSPNGWGGNCSLPEGVSLQSRLWGWSCLSSLVWRGVKTLLTGRGAQNWNALHCPSRQPFSRIPFMSRWCSPDSSACSALCCPARRLLLKCYEPFPNSQITFICCQFITVCSWILLLIFFLSWWLFWWQPYSSLALYCRLGQCCCFIETNPGSSEFASGWLYWASSDVALLIHTQGTRLGRALGVPQAMLCPPDTELCCIPALLQPPHSALAASSAQVRPKVPHLLSGFWVSIPAASADNGACCISQVSFCTMTLTTEWFLT